MEVVRIRTVSVIPISRTPTLWTHGVIPEEPDAIINTSVSPEKGVSPFGYALTIPLLATRPNITVIIVGSVITNTSLCTTSVGLTAIVEFSRTPSAVGTRKGVSIALSIIRDNDRGSPLLQTAIYTRSIIVAGIVNLSITLATSLTPPLKKRRFVL